MCYFAVFTESNLLKIMKNIIIKNLTIVKQVKLVSRGKYDMMKFV